MADNPLQGIFAFYKGFLPNFGRMGSWNTIMFLTLEQVRFVNNFLSLWYYSFDKCKLWLLASFLLLLVGLECVVAFHILLGYVFFEGEKRREKFLSFPPCLV